MEGIDGVYNIIREKLKCYDICKSLNTDSSILSVTLCFKCTRALVPRKTNCCNLQGYCHRKPLSHTEIL